MLASYYTFFFFFNDTATTEIYTLSLHDALPISLVVGAGESETIPLLDIARQRFRRQFAERNDTLFFPLAEYARSEEHTSELQSQSNLVCRLLLEKKKKKRHTIYYRL